MQSSLKTILAILMVPAFALAGEPANKDTTRDIDLTKISLKDDPFVAQLDSLMEVAFFREDLSADTSFRPLPEEVDSLFTVPVFSDSVYTARIANLDAQTPMALEYAPVVKQFIHLYSVRRRKQMSRMMGLAEYYFPMFEEHLAKYNMPLELKYLAVVESALNPTAQSWAGAKGLWQFMYSTGKLNGLELSSYVDERHDPLKSTEAACKYLTKLHDIFDDWNLALAAYNSGPGNVNKAIRRSGGYRDYWSIRPFLPRETRSYVPAFIAVNYVMNYAEEHQIYARGVKPSYFQTDTVEIKKTVSFDQLTELLEIDKATLQFLNPEYRYELIPADAEKAYYLTLPKNKIGLFVSNEDSIYALAAQNFKKENKNLPHYFKHGDAIYHRVQRGEVLGLIAERYGVGVSSVRRWNGIRGNMIRVGQRLKIYPRKMPDKQTQTASRSTQTKSDKSGKYVNYSVHYGESFYSIARKYPGISAENIMEWNNIANARSLKPGMRLKIYTEGS